MFAIKAAWFGFGFLTGIVLLMFYLTALADRRGQPRSLPGLAELRAAEKRKRRGPGAIRALTPRSASRGGEFRPQ